MLAALEADALTSKPTNRYARAQCNVVVVVVAIIVVAAALHADEVKDPVDDVEGGEGEREESPRGLVHLTAGVHAVQTGVGTVRIHSSSCGEGVWQAVSRTVGRLERVHVDR